MNRLLPTPNGEYGSFCCEVAYNGEHKYDTYILKEEQLATTYAEAVEQYGEERAAYHFRPTSLIHNLTLDVWFVAQPGTGSKFDYVPNPIAEKVAAECEKGESYVGHYINGKLNWKS